MPNTYGPRSEQTELVMERGSYVSATAKYRVTDVDDSNSDLRNLKDAIDNGSVPAAGSSPTGITNLILEGYRISPVPGQKSKMDVVCEYVSKGRSRQNFVEHARGSLVQETTQKNILGADLVVTFGTESHVAEVSVLKPTLHLTLQGVLQRQKPLLTAYQWIGKLNSVAWKDGPAQKWLCTNVTMELLDDSTTPKKYDATFEFEYKDSGWQPGVLYRNADGTVPTGLLAGTGYYRAGVYPTRDYRELFS